VVSVIELETTTFVGVSEDPIDSSDIVGDPRASVIHIGMPRVVNQTLVKGRQLV